MRPGWLQCIYVQAFDEARLSLKELQGAELLLARYWLRASAASRR
jgi:hypothetical protein